MAESGEINYFQPPKKNIDYYLTSPQENTGRPNTTHYRIENGKRVEKYIRESLSPQPKDTRIVLQATYSIAGGETGKRYLQTEGAGPCVVATLYDKSTKTGIMFHFDSRSIVPTALRDSEKRLENPLSNFEMIIIGGYQTDSSSERLVRSLRSFAHYGNIRIVEEDVLESGAQRETVNVVLDTETGDLYNLPIDHSGTSVSKAVLDRIAHRQKEIIDDPLAAYGKVAYIEEI